MSIYRVINPTMNRLLRSPWHRLMSKRVMSVSYRGRKSGKAYRTPVSYYREDDRVFCFPNGAWRHNFVDEHDATLRIAGKDYTATGRLCERGQEEQLDLMSAYFDAVPQDRKFYGVKCGADGKPLRSQVNAALKRIEIIEFELGSR